MSASYDIVGYIYHADLYCPSCIAEMFAGVPFHEIVDDRLDGTERVLARVAATRGIDYTDEASYDSGDFPKVAFRDQVESDDCCGACYAPLD